MSSTAKKPRGRPRKTETGTGQKAPSKNPRGRPSNPPRRPLSSEYDEIAKREGYVRALMKELDETTGDTARSALLKMIGQAFRHFDEVPKQEDEQGPLTHEEACTLLEQDAPDWSDRQLLIIHAEGLRRGIPGFVERE